MAIRKSSSSGTPFGDTSGRPASASVGQTYYNGQLGYLEIYTVSGWIPATGANDFSLNITGLNTAVTFSQTYSSGSYSIVSFLNDATVDVYAYNDDGSLAGYSNTKAFTATQRFNKMVVLGGSAGDVLQFSYKTTYATATSTTDVTAGPYITSITPSGVPNQNDTVTITGGNFASNVAATFTGTGYSATSAKSIVRSSSTSLIVTRPDSLPVSGAPYTITVSNPGVTSPTGSSVHQYSPITAGAVPVWQTSTSLAASVYGSAYSTSVSATDADGSSSISYSAVSGTLPTGISFNTSTGAITGTPTSPTPGTYSYTVRATDSGGNYADRTFTTSYSTISGGTLTSDATYYYRVFNSTGTLIFGQPLTTDVLMVGGGGGGGFDVGSGGGAGGVVIKTSYSLSAGSYPITVGAGGPAKLNSSSADPSTNYTGINTTFNNFIAYGGGGAGSWQSTVAAAGGSGGGGAVGYSGASTSGGAALQPSSATGGYGNAGGTGTGSGGANEYSGAAGGGGAGAAGGNGSSNWATAADSSTAVGGIGVLISQFSLTGMGDPSFAGWYGGGGGASTDGGGGWSYGGKGGGGDGTNRKVAQGTGTGGYYYIDGKPNTGGGGGGGGSISGATYPSSSGNSGGPGGSGVFMIRYTKASVGG